MRFSLSIFRYSFAYLAIAFFAGACGTTYGMYHRAEPGETLGAVARAYNVDDEALRIINSLENDYLEPGQQIFIPGATRQRYVSGSAPAPKPPAPVAAATPPAATPRMPGPDVARIQPESAPDRPSSHAFVWPVNATLSSKFGLRDGLPHDGIDLSAPSGTPIIAAADGRVIYSGDEVKGYGNLIIVKHEGFYSTVYAHNSENLAQKGDFVEAGQLIGRVGDTGRASGPHLHFEVRYKSKPVNPLEKLPEASVRLTNR